MLWLGVFAGKGAGQPGFPGLVSLGSQLSLQVCFPFEIPSYLKCQGFVTNRAVAVREAGGMNGALVGKYPCRDSLFCSGAKTNNNTKMLLLPVPRLLVWKERATNSVLHLLNNFQS